MAKYTLPNLSRQGKRITKRFYSVIGELFENTVFLFIGIALYGFNHPFR